MEIFWPRHCTPSETVLFQAGLTIMASQPEIKAVMIHLLPYYFYKVK